MSKVELDGRDTARTFNMRRTPVIELECLHCGMKNSVKMNA